MNSGFQWHSFQLYKTYEENRSNLGQAGHSLKGFTEVMLDIKSQNKDGFVCGVARGSAQSVAGVQSGDRAHCRVRAVMTTWDRAYSLETDQCVGANQLNLDLCCGVEGLRLRAGQGLRVTQVGGKVLARG